MQPEKGSRRGIGSMGAPVGSEHVTSETCTIADEGFVPHSPVRLYIEADARDAMVRQLKVPMGFEAVLPAGPVNRTPEGSTIPQGSGGGSDYVGLLRQMEKELCAVESLSKEEAAKKSGREVGAKYCWKKCNGGSTGGLEQDYLRLQGLEEVCSLAERHRQNKEQEGSKLGQVEASVLQASETRRGYGDGRAEQDDGDLRRLANIAIQ